MTHLLPGPVQRGDEVVVFDTSAAPTADRSGWVVPLHAWVRDDRPLGPVPGLVDLAARALELTPDPADEDIFRERARPFLADDESWREVKVRVAGRLRTLPLTDSEGHARSTVVLPRRAGAPASVPVNAVLPRGDHRRVRGRVHLVGPTGVSVISDVDDTVKVSDVVDRTELLANTFLRPFRPVPGMPELYGSWAARGAAFHYVTSSPWQLYHPLRRFFAEVGLPGGSMEMKTFSVTLERFTALFADPLRTKLPSVEAILRAWPHRRFVLVGDSGEKDPEVYAAAARRSPGRVERIYIRRVPGSDLTDARFDEAFAGLPGGLGATFEDPADLRLP